MSSIMTKHLKKILMVDHEILDYILLGQIGPKLPVCPQKGYLSEI